MSKTINIGKNTLGSGGKMEINLHNYDSTTSDKGYTIKTTGSAGTLIPFMSELALPESEWEIILDTGVNIDGRSFSDFDRSINSLIFTLPLTTRAIKK